MPINESSSLLVSYILKMSNGLKGNILKKTDIFKLSYNGMDAQISLDKINHLGNFMQIEVCRDPYTIIFWINEVIQFQQYYIGSDTFRRELRS